MNTDKFCLPDFNEHLQETKKSEEMEYLTKVMTTGTETVQKAACKIIEQQQEMKKIQEKLEARVKELDNENIELRENLVELQCRKDQEQMDLRRELRDKKELKKASDKNLLDSKRENSQLLKEIEELRERLVEQSELQKRLKELQESNESSETERQGLKLKESNEISELTRRVQQLQREIVDLQSDKSASTAEIYNLKKDKTSLQNQLDNLKKSESTASNARGNAQEETIRQLTIQLEAAKKEAQEATKSLMKEKLSLKEICIGFGKVLKKKKPDGVDSLEDFRVWINKELKAVMVSRADVLNELQTVKKEYKQIEDRVKVAGQGKDDLIRKLNEQIQTQTKEMERIEKENEEMKKAQNEISIGSSSSSSDSGESIDKLKQKLKREEECTKLLKARVRKAECDSQDYRKSFEESEEKIQEYKLSLDKANDELDNLRNNCKCGGARGLVPTSTSSTTTAIPSSTSGGDNHNSPNVIQKQKLVTIYSAQDKEENHKIIPQTNCVDWICPICSAVCKDNDDLNAHLDECAED